MHITHLGVAGFGPFGNPIEFDPDDPYDGPPLHDCCAVTCDDRVNLFVGTNSSGKTSLLRAIDYLYCLDGTESYPERNPFQGWLELSNDWPVEHRPDTNRSMPLPGGKVPLIHFPSTRVNLPAGRFSHEGLVYMDEDEFGFGWKPPWITDEYMALVTDESGRLHNWPLEPYGDLFQTQDGVFFGGHVEDAFHQLGNLFHNFAPSRIETLSEAITTGHACAQAICSEVMENSSPHPYTRNVEFRNREYGEFLEMQGLEPEKAYQEEVTLHAMGITTRADPLGKPLYAGNLSSGTQSTLLWIWALALEMANHYGWEKGWKNQPAILLIDEIENHLHPTWQRRVIPTLLEHFPGLQIFATTHSPYVVAGLKAGQVHRMFRNPVSAVLRFQQGDNQIEVETNGEDIVGWTSDEISRGYLDMMDPTDLATARAAQELRQLRDEGPRDDPKEEENRQERMLELHSIVNYDLLFGGARPAEEVLFEEDFTAAVRRYHDYNNLN